MFDWFGKKKSTLETSPGGSVINRYPAKDWAATPIGVLPEAADRFAKVREAAYAPIFGEAENVSHEIFPLIPHIDVFQYKRRSAGGAEVCALVTSGMSDLPMKVPAKLNAPRRVELIFYCTEAKPEYIETLRWLAHFPHDQKTWIGVGHTIPNGNPPAPFWGSSILDTILFMPTIVNKDRGISTELVLDSDPVDLLWVVPLSTPECNLKLEKGYNAIIELFQQHRHPHVYQPERASYV